jgi:hypothetical protein
VALDLYLEQEPEKDYCVENQKHHESFFVSQDVVLDSREDVVLEVDPRSESLSSIRVVVRRLKEGIHEFAVDDTKLNHQQEVVKVSLKENRVDIGVIHVVDLDFN